MFIDQMKLKIKVLFLLFFGFAAQSLAQQGQYFGQTEIGFLSGKSQDLWDESHETRFGATLMTFNGIHLTNNHVIGFVTGIDQYEGLTILPLAIGWRGFFGKDGNARIFGGLDIGGGSAVFEKYTKDEWSKSWYEGGYLVSPSIGVTLPTKYDKTAFSFSIAYRRQQVSNYYAVLSQPGTQTFQTELLPPGYSSLTENDYLFRSFVFRVGLRY